MRKRDTSAPASDLRAEVAALRRRVANLERSKAMHAQVNHALKNLVFKLDDATKGALRAVDAALRMQGVSQQHVHEIIHGLRLTGMPPELTVLPGGDRPAVGPKRRARRLRVVSPRGRRRS